MDKLYLVLYCIIHFLCSSCKNNTTTITKEETIVKEEGEAQSVMGDECDTEECYYYLEDILHKYNIGDEIIQIKSIPYNGTENYIYTVDSLFKIKKQLIDFTPNITLENYTVYEKNTVGSYGFLEDYVDSIGNSFSSQFILKKGQEVPVLQSNKVKNKYFPYTWNSIYAYSVSYEDGKEIIVISLSKPYASTDVFYPLEVLFCFDSEDNLIKIISDPVID